MFKFLFVMFFFFILLVFLMGFSILRTFKNMLFGNGSHEKKGEQRRQASSYSGGHHQADMDKEDEYTSSNRKKIFAKDEGEYVDFEEVK